MKASGPRSLLIFSVQVVNDSNDDGDVCIFRTNGSEGAANLVAFLAHRVAPGDDYQFTWQEQYTFIGAETGVLKPGVSVFPRYTAGGDPNAANATSFTTRGFGTPQREALPGGTLAISIPSALPLQRYSIGMGMQGAPFVVAQAMPEMKYVFLVQLPYWIVFGKFKQGTVLDPGQLANAALLPFTANNPAVRATRTSSGEWIVEIV